MSLKIRLQRQGKRGKPYYWIVAADSRQKRDGKYLEKLGTYDPLTNPATVELNLDSAVNWLQNGAKPSDTARDLLSSKGAMLKNHLLTGVRKGALSKEEAEKKFQEWVEEKEGKLQERKEAHEQSIADAKAKALEAEKKVNAERQAAAEEAGAEVQAEAVDAKRTAESGDAEAAEPKEEADDGKTEIEKQAEAAEKSDDKGE